MSTLSSVESLTCVQFKPESTLRILHYDGVMPSVALDVLERCFPEHTDSSLITVAPRSSLAALEMKRFDTNEWVREDTHTHTPQAST